MPNSDKWVISSSGSHMFVRFSVWIVLNAPGFIAKIHQGKKDQELRNRT